VRILFWFHLFFLGKINKALFEKNSMYARKKLVFQLVDDLRVLVNEHLQLSDEELVERVEYSRLEFNARYKEAN
jgi:hypothetical protein